jgi:hypothetical protein
VGDEDQRQAMLALQVAQQVEVLRLDGEIEAGGRLVGDQQARLAGNADGACRPTFREETASRGFLAMRCAPT